MPKHNLVMLTFAQPSHVMRLTRLMRRNLFLRQSRAKLVRRHAGIMPRYSGHLRATRFEATHRRLSVNQIGVFI